MRAACSLTAILLAGWLFAGPPTASEHPDVLQPPRDQGPATPVENVVIVEVEGDVTYGLYASIKRRTEQALELEPDLLIFRIDTYGGTADSALKIAEVIFQVEEPTTVAYIPKGKRAISAGALIAMACRQMVMGEGSKIGDCQPILPTAEGITPAGEKIESLLRTSFRSYAKRNGYPVALAEAMVSTHIEVHELVIDGEVRYVRSEEVEDLRTRYGEKVTGDKVVLAEGELLTMDDEEAYRYGFARAVVRSQEGMLAVYGAQPGQATELVTNWSEELVRFLDLMGPLLLAAGLLGLYLEFKTPGFGLPGLVGIVCLALYFGSKYLVGLADAIDVLLFLIGVALLAVELFVIPGFGIVGAVGLVFIVAGLLLSFQPFIIPRSTSEVDWLKWSFLQLIVAMGIVLTAAFLLGRYLHTTPLFRRLVHTAEPVEQEVYSSAAPAEQHLHRLLGARGVTTTYCRPAGKAFFDNELVDVVAQGEYIERAREVKVVDLEGNRVVVRAV